MYTQYDACITTIVSHAESASLMSSTYAFFGVRPPSSLPLDNADPFSTPQIGAFASPLLIGGFIDRDVNWNWYYCVPCGLSLILAVVAFFVFRGCASFRRFSSSTSTS
jgi:hypothetical protein